MRYLVRSVPERVAWLREIRAQIPQLEVIRDRTRNAWDTFLLALRASGEDAAVHLEDDIILTSAFCPKVEAAIAARPAQLIQFFSRRQDDQSLGSRARPGADFSWNTCFYLPPGYGAALLAYAPHWPRHAIHPWGYDLMMADWLKSRHEHYWLHVPSLVQHRAGRSIIDPRRSGRRHSATFQP